MPAPSIPSIPYQFTVTAEIVIDRAQDGTPTVVDKIGSFVFRRPTRREEKDTALRRDADLSRIADPQGMSAEVFYRVMFEATIPYLIVDKPEHLDFEYLTLNQVVAIYEAYEEGLRKLTQPLNLAQAGPGQGEAKTQEAALP